MCVAIDLLVTISIAKTGQKRFCMTLSNFRHCDTIINVHKVIAILSFHKLHLRWLRIDSKLIFISGTSCCVHNFQMWIMKQNSLTTNV